MADRRWHDAFVSKRCAADAGDITESINLYMQKLYCQTCHGWAGDGGKTDYPMPEGADLRESQIKWEIVLAVLPGNT